MDDQKEILLSPPSMTGAEIVALNKAIESNWIAPMGPAVDEFESAIANILGKQSKVIALNSGTSALHMALIDCGVTAGDYVICQSFTFAASVNPVLYQGAIPVFVDSEPLTWNMDPKYLKKAIDHIQESEKVLPKAIILVHSYGVPFQYDEIREVADHYQIPLIEDSAEALGSTYKGRPCGTLGDYAALSFNGNKIITCSSGGVLVCPDEESKERVRFRSRQASTSPVDYHHTETGYNCGMSNICAAIGNGQLSGLDRKLEKRKAIHQNYLDQFSKYQVEIFEPQKEFTSNFWLNCVHIDWQAKGLTLDQVYDHFWDHNIQVRAVWKPLHLQPYLSHYAYFGQQCAEQLYHSWICLPSGDQMDEQDVNRVVEALVKLINP